MSKTEQVTIDVPPAPTPAEIVVEFERVGRHRNVPDLSLPCTIMPDDAADAIYKHARPFLLSRDFEVSVTLPHDGKDGWVQIGLGRYGRGVVRYAP